MLKTSFCINLHGSEDEIIVKEVFEFRIPEVTRHKFQKTSVPIGWFLTAVVTILLGHFLTRGLNGNNLLGDLSSLTPIAFQTEGCQSGRMERSRKPSGVQASRGFKSPPFRHVNPCIH